MTLDLGLIKPWGPPFVAHDAEQERDYRNYMRENVDLHCLPTTGQWLAEWKYSPFQFWCIEDSNDAAYATLIWELQQAGIVPW